MTGQKRRKAVADSKGNVREKGGIKSPIITRVEKGSGGDCAGDHGEVG